MIGCKSRGEKLLMVIVAHLTSISVASIRRKLLKTTHTKERSAQTNLEFSNFDSDRKKKSI